MTTVNVTYRVLARPHEASVVALDTLREVYGIRSLRLDEGTMELLLEFDSTRLSEQIVRQLVRRTGLQIDLLSPAPVTTGTTTG